MPEGSSPRIFPFVRATPYILTALAIGLFSIMNAIVKAMSTEYDTLQVAFLRYLFGGLVILAIVCWKRPGWPSIETVEACVVRGLLGLTTGLSFFYALNSLPLAYAIALSFLAPLFMTLFSMILLKEVPRLAAVLALGLGFIGMLVMISGKDASGEHSWFGIGASILSAITYGLSTTMLRSRAQKDPLDVIVFFQNWVPAMFIAPANGVVWQPLEHGHLIPFAALGILGVGAHLLFAKAYSMAETSRLAPLEYSALIYAAVLGYGLFGEVPTLTTLGGAVLIIAGAVLTSRR